MGNSLGPIRSGASMAQAIRKLEGWKRPRTRKTITCSLHKSCFAPRSSAANRAARIIASTARNRLRAGPTQFLQAGTPALPNPATAQAVGLRDSIPAARGPRPDHRDRTRRGSRQAGRHHDAGRRPGRHDDVSVHPQPRTGSDRRRRRRAARSFATSGAGNRNDRCGGWQRVAAGDTVVELAGAAGTLLTGERTILNLMGRLSGIATATAAVVALVEGTGVAIKDTRKTTPGLRALEKYAVRSAAASITARVSTTPCLSRTTTSASRVPSRRRWNACARRSARTRRSR